MLEPKDTRTSQRRHPGKSWWRKPSSPATKKQVTLSSPGLEDFSRHKSFVSELGQRLCAQAVRKSSSARPIKGQTHTRIDCGLTTKLGSFGSSTSSHYCSPVPPLVVPAEKSVSLWGVTPCTIDRRIEGLADEFKTSEGPMRCAVETRMCRNNHAGFFSAHQRTGLSRVPVWFVCFPPFLDLCPAGSCLTLLELNPGL